MDSRYKRQSNIPVEGTQAMIHNFSHDRVLFIYTRSKQVKVLNAYDAAIFDISFERPNWKHTATLDAVWFMKQLLVENKKYQRKMLDQLVSDI